MHTQTAAVYGAFIMEGLHELNYDKTLEKWDRGCIELVDQLCNYAEVIDKLVTEYEDPDMGHPGVFLYEVVSPFGAWMGKKVIETGNTPPVEEAEDWLRNATKEFFKPGVRHVAHV